MADWLLARGFHLIDKCTRNHLFECLKHRAEIAKWLAPLTEGERFNLNHPTTVLRKWKAKTVVPDPNEPRKPSPIAKLKEVNIELQEKLHRAEQELSRGGGGLWSANDAADDVATVMVAKLSKDKAESVARAILKLTNKKSASAPAARTKPPKPAEHLTNEEVEALFKDYRKLELSELEDCILRIQRASPHRHLSDHQWRALDRMRERAADLKKTATHLASADHKPPTAQPGLGEVHRNGGNHAHP
jgi:hypothetical protein